MKIIVLEGSNMKKYKVNTIFQFKKIQMNTGCSPKKIPHFNKKKSK